MYRAAIQNLYESLLPELQSGLDSIVGKSRVTAIANSPTTTIGKTTSSYEISCRYPLGTATI